MERTKVGHRVTAMVHLRLLLPFPDVLRKLFLDTVPAKGMAAMLGGLLEYLLPGQAAKEMVGAAVAFIILDTVTALYAVAVTGKKIESAKAARVLSKLIGYFSVVAVCSVATSTIPGASGLQGRMISAVLGFVLLTEGISIIENVGKMGVKTPLFIRKRLKAMLLEQADPEKEEEKV